MTDYSKSKIYIITNSINEETYVGSTTESLKSRLYHHICNSKNRPGNNNKLYEHMSKHSTDAFSISLLEEYPCKSKADLELKEAEYIKQQGTLNLIVPKRTKTQWDLEKPGKRKDYQKKWRDEHVEYRAEYSKDYRTNNLEHIKTYYKEKIKCECGCEVARGNINGHRNSEKHKLRMTGQLIDTETKQQIEKEHRGETIICNVCGCSIARGNMPTHTKTIKCINFGKSFQS